MSKAHTHQVARFKYQVCQTYDIDVVSTDSCLRALQTNFVKFF